MPVLGARRAEAMLASVGAAKLCSRLRHLIERQDSYRKTVLFNQQGYVFVRQKPLNNSENPDGLIKKVIGILLL